MALLTNADYRQIQTLIQLDPTAKGLLKSWGLSKATWKSLFQACEDWNVSGFNARPGTSYKAAVDAVIMTTPQQAKMVWVIWSRWKAPQVI